MKLCNDTIAILKNFANINTNILFRQGSTISTISNAKNIYAKATINENIPKEFAIYDLNSMLAMITLVDNQELTFKDKSVVAESEKGQFEYFYSSPDLVTAAPTAEIDHTTVYTFKLAAQDIQMLMKAAAITSAPTISVTSKNQHASICVNDRKNDTSSNFKRSLGTSFDEFDVYIAVENLKVIPDAYTVEIAKTPNGKAKFLYFKHESKPLQYWIACEPGSVV